VTVWAAVALALVAAAASVFVEVGRGDGAEGLDLYSTFSPSPDGTKAIYELVSELGYEAERHLEPLDAADLEGVRLVVILQPIVAPDLAEEETLLDWLEAGGTVLLGGELPGRLGMVGRRGGLDDPLSYHHPARGNLPKAEGDEDWTRAPSPLASELLEGVDRLVWTPVLSREERSVAVEAGGAVPRRAGHTVLVSRNGFSFLEVTEVGEGLVVKARYVDLFINKNIDRGRNLVLLLNVLESRVRDGRIVFDEGHRRLDPEDQGDVWDVLGTGAEIAFLQLLLAVAAGLVALGARPAPPLADREVRRRRAVQQVEALASMLERAGAYALAVRLIHGRVRRLCRAAGRRGTGGERRGRILGELEELSRAADDEGGLDRRELTRYVRLYFELVRGEDDR
jgi:hypothetical protein